MGLIGPMEARLLAVERLQARLDHDLRGMRRDVIALSQGIWDAWSDVRLPIAVTTPTCEVTDFDYCPCLPATIPLHDSYYGDCTLTYDPSQLAWFGCKLVSLPANPSCTAGRASFVLHYILTGQNDVDGWPIAIRYQASNFTTLCPAANTNCSNATNAGTSFIMTMHCTGTSSVTFTVNGTIPGTQCYPAFRNVTLTITLPDPVDPLP